ncbi:MAG: hypothetical protein WA160_05155 [Pseudobdellovibrio sp.]
MNTNENSDKVRQKKIIFSFITFAIFFAVLTLIPSVRNELTTILNPPNRTVLAKITGFYLPDQMQFLILKVKNAGGLQIEIFDVDAKTAVQTFKQKFDLAEDSDAYVTLDKNSTNLALQDVDHDGNMDIVAPSVDRNGNLRLNTFRFNADLKMFEVYQGKIE